MKHSIQENDMYECSVRMLAVIPHTYDMSFTCIWTHLYGKHSRSLKMPHSGWNNTHIPNSMIRTPKTLLNENAPALKHLQRPTLNNPLAQKSFCPNEPTHIQTRFSRESAAKKTDTHTHRQDRFYYLHRNGRLAMEVWYNHKGLESRLCAQWIVIICNFFFQVANHKETLIPKTFVVDHQHILLHMLIFYFNLCQNGHRSTTCYTRGRLLICTNFTMFTDGSVYANVWQKKKKQTHTHTKTTTYTANQQILACRKINLANLAMTEFLLN